MEDGPTGHLMMTATAQKMIPGTGLNSNGETVMTLNPDMVVMIAKVMTGLRPHVIQVSVGHKLSWQNKVSLPVNCVGVDGSWSELSNWTECDENCSKTGYRTCSNPESMFGGSNCSGNADIAYPCLSDNCSSKQYHILIFYCQVLCFKTQQSGFLQSLYQSTGSDCFIIGAYPENNNLEEHVPFQNLTRPLDCQSFCQNHPNCELFTIIFPPHDKAGCWLKSGTDNIQAVSNDHVLSGPKFCPSKYDYSKALPYANNYRVFQVA